MLDTYKFGEQLKKLGYDFYSGVPCSFLSNFINYAINECDYIMAANEGDAVAISTGAMLTNKKSVVLMQNSGLTNAISPLTSLNFTFKIPVLGFVSLRGEIGLNDEPQHELMGRVTEQFLYTIGIKWEYLSLDSAEAEIQIKRANECIENNETFFFIVRKNTFDEVELKKQSVVTTKTKLFIQKETDDLCPTRLSALETISKSTDDCVLLATTGKTGRELYEIKDRKNNLYMVGSMGCASSLGLGISINTDKKVVVVDGDGSLLMRLGSMSTNAYCAPKNMLHILLDNNSYDSTGGQDTISNNVDFINIAKSCGYENIIYCHDLNDLEETINNFRKNKGLTFIYLKIKKGSKKNLGRPGIKPYEVKDRLIKFINE